MDLMAENLNGEWYSSFPQRGAVYDLAYAALSGKTRDTRLQAVIMLGKSNDPRAVRPLVGLLGDPDNGIRGAATNALGNLKSGRSVEALLDRLWDRSEDTDVRNQAILALATIRSTGALRGLREFAAEAEDEPALRSLAGEILLKTEKW
jgi:HEAT repeat protein